MSIHEKLVQEMKEISHNLVVVSVVVLASHSVSYTKTYVYHNITVYSKTFEGENFRV